ncbi:MAG TPA: major facilitator superfamily domain-containing protein 6 [Anaerolineales bacterium]
MISAVDAEERRNEPRDLWVLYFGYYMALGALSPYIALYYERSGLSGVQIGLLSSLILAMTSLTAIPWGAVADRYRLHRPILSVAFLLAGAFVFLISLTTNFLLLIPLVLGYALFIAPIVPLLDSSAVAAAKAGRRSFGQIRVGGSLGWIVSVWLVGILVQSFGMRWLFYICIVSMALTLFYVLSHPPRSASSQIEIGRNLRLLLSDRSVVFFLLSVFLVAVGNGAVQNFFSLYLDGIGAQAGVIGAAWAVAAISEIPVMLASGKLLRWIGPAGLLKIAFFVYALRWLLFSFIHDPLWALAAQPLQGLSFAAYLTAGVTYLNERTPEGLGATAQAVLGVVSFGVAAIVGSLAGGYLYDHAGMPVFFRIFSAVTLAGLVLFWLTSAQPRRGPQGATPESSARP